MDSNPIPTKQQELQQELNKKISSIQTDKLEEETKAQAKALSLPYADLRSFPINVNALVILTEAESRTGQMAIIDKTGQNISIAVKDSQNAETKYILDGLKNRGFIIELVIVSIMSLQAAWLRYEGKKEAAKTSEGIVDISQAKFIDLKAKIKNLSDIKSNLSSLSITETLDTLLAGALQIKASDIHFEPEEKTIRLRYRLDGVLQDVINFSPEGYPNILSRIKLLSGLKINVHETPQDGRFTIRQEKGDIEVRVSILPGAYGENIVMRILNPDAINVDLSNLGLRPDTLEIVGRLLKKTTGAILTTGPTGSGKTTTLYSFIKQVNNPGVKIITIEDPIEYHIEGINQTQVEEAADYTFANGLRSIMRQDPDVILIGEIRDQETAEIAMQAALTGHLVFSTLHTNDAAGTVPRLIDLGVKATSIAPAIKAAMAQRLIRRLCETCKKKEKIRSEDWQLIQKYLTDVKQEIVGKQLQENLEIFYPVGCSTCDTSGYQGRLGLFEIFEIDEDIEKIILTSPAISEMRNIAIQKGMVTMLQDGLIRVLQGVTSIQEVIRVVGE